MYRIMGIILDQWKSWWQDVRDRRRNYAWWILSLELSLARKPGTIFILSISGTSDSLDDDHWILSSARLIKMHQISPRKFHESHRGKRDFRMIGWQKCVISRRMKNNYLIRIEQKKLWRYALARWTYEDSLRHERLAWFTCFRYIMLIGTEISLRFLIVLIISKPFRNLMSLEKII